MTKTKQKFIVLLCIVLFISILLSTFFIKNSSAYAETKTYFSAEQYTESDNLLNSDGTENEEITIRNFADDVKAAKHNEIIEDLPKVIPLEYLESNKSGIFAYMGKEYGFYIYKQDTLFYTLLIDFICEPTNSNNNEYRVQIKPILQQCFCRQKSMGETVWTKEEDDRYKLFVANPHFWAEVDNANSLNYGDSGYSKQTDAGLIVSQSRLNYKVVELPSAIEVFCAIGECMRDVVVEWVDKATTVYDLITDSNWGELKNTYDFVVNLEQSIRDKLKVENIESNNEKNISTNKTKSEQLTDDNLKSFYRSALVKLEGDLLISAENDGYAEMIVQLNETNYRSQLTQICDFDIFCRGSIWDKAEKVTGPNGEDRFGFYQEYTILDDKEPYFEIDDDFDKNNVPVYMLPHGNQLLTFTPKYSGEYKFDIPLGATLKIDGLQGVSFKLNAGKTYKLELINNLSVKIIDGLYCTVAQYAENQTYNIPSRSQMIVRYQHNSSNYFKIKASNPNIKIGILDDNLKMITSADSNVILGNFIQGKIYYFLLENDTASAMSTEISISQPNNMELDQKYIITAEEKTMIFQNDNYDATYRLVLNNTGKSNVTVTDITGKSLIAGTEYKGNDIIYTLELKENEKCFINFAQADGSVSAQLFISPTQCRWWIDGEPVNGFSTKLKPNSSHSIRAEISSDGQNFKAVETITILTTVKYSFNDGILEIEDVANGEIIWLVPTYAANMALSIEIDDMITNITLNHNSGTGYNGTISVELGQRINCSGIPAPTRTGYTFKGYYDVKQDSGTQYITEKMVGLTWNIDVDNATLYAHWSLTEYELYFCDGTFVDEKGKEQDIVLYSYTMRYGDSFPTDMNWAPKKSGHHFLGYYDENGIKYYSVTANMLNDRQSADLYGYKNYYVEGMEFCYNESKWQLKDDLKLYAHWSKLKISDYKVQAIIEGKAQSSWWSIGGITHEQSIRVSPQDVSGGEFKHFMVGGVVVSGTVISWTPYLTWNPTTGEIVPSNELIAVYTPKECVAEGTLITLANGKQVPVESLTGDEMLLVWNLQTGTFDSAKILFIDKDPATTYRVINLTFSDGTTVKVISEHAFWDFDLNEYVYLRADAAKYIGHWFNKQIINPDGSFGYTKVQLTDVNVRDEFTTAYSPVTYGHLCYYVNGMLSMPGGIGGLFNIFEVDAETMTIDTEAFDKDIDTYGLFAYEEFAEILPVSEEVFEAFNGQYLKVAIGKGLIDVETLTSLVERYSPFFE